MASSTKSGFSAEERAAMKERARELKLSKSRDEAEKDQLKKIAEMPKVDREIAEGVHAIVKEHAPELESKTWYGMPGYARDGKIMFFVQSAEKFKTRYTTFGFNDIANLDDGDLWPTAYAIPEWSAAAEKKVTALVKKAVS